MKDKISSESINLIWKKLYLYLFSLNNNQEQEPINWCQLFMNSIQSELEMNNKLFGNDTRFKLIFKLSILNGQTYLLRELFPEKFKNIVDCFSNVDLFKEYYLNPEPSHMVI